MIEFRDVDMVYTGRFRLRKGGALRVQALHGLNLTVSAGERLAIFGENGAGKSTLLRLVGGMLIPSSGRVLVQGADAARRTSKALPKIGYVFTEERSFYFRLTGVENLRFFAALDDQFGRAAASEAARVLDAVGLGSAARRPVGEYSTGMRQRLALARGLLGGPEVLLLDEPTRSLDPAGTDAIHALLRSPLLANCTLLMATNRFEDASNLCSRAVVLRGGRVSASKSVSEQTSVEVLSQFVREQIAEEAAAGVP